MKLEAVLRFSWKSVGLFDSKRAWLFSVPSGNEFVLKGNEYIPTLKFKGIVLFGFSIQVVEVLV